MYFFLFNVYRFIFLRFNAFENQSYIKKKGKRKVFPLKLGQAKARSFFRVSHVGAWAQGLRPSFAPYPEVQQPACDSAYIQDAGIVGGDLGCCTTVQTLTMSF